MKIPACVSLCNITTHWQSSVKLERLYHDNLDMFFICQAPTFVYNPDLYIISHSCIWQDPQDVRTCMLQFMMSFLISGDDLVIKQLVDSKGKFRKTSTVSNISSQVITFS